MSSLSPTMAYRQALEEVLIAGDDADGRAVRIPELVEEWESSMGTDFYRSVFLGLKLPSLNVVSLSDPLSPLSSSNNALGYAG
jgi:hypothetical protein